MPESVEALELSVLPQQGTREGGAIRDAPAKRTYVIGSRQICEGPECVGFSKVVCAAAGD
jgi:hypothetical protein